MASVFVPFYWCCVRAVLVAVVWCGVRCCVSFVSLSCWSFARVVLLCFTAVFVCVCSVVVMFVICCCRWCLPFCIAVVLLM